MMERFKKKHAKLKFWNADETFAAHGFERIIEKKVPMAAALFGHDMVRRN